MKANSELADVTRYEEATNADLVSDKQADVTIVCRRNRESEPYTFTVLLRSGLFIDGGISEVEITHEAAQSFLSKMTKNLQGILEREFESEQMDAVMMQIKSIGYELYKQLIPGKLQDFMEDMSEGAIVKISAKDMWIPWEILFDGTNFWGTRFDLRRFPIIPIDANAAIGARRSEGRLAVHNIKRVLNIVGDDMSDKETEAAKGTFNDLKEIHDFNILLLEGEPIHKLNANMRSADISHFSCHGIVSDSGHYLRLGPGQEHRLTVQCVKLFELDGGLVFANSCCSAAPSKLLGSFMSFGWAFYEVGAEVFIGTLVSVPTKYALDFAREFYRLWLSGKRSCGNALRLAKLEELEKLKMSEASNPFWLFYCLYGDG